MQPQDVRIGAPVPRQLFQQVGPVLSPSPVPVWPQAPQQVAQPVASPRPIVPPFPWGPSGLGPSNNQMRPALPVQSKYVSMPPPVARPVSVVQDNRYSCVAPAY